MQVRPRLDQSTPRTEQSELPAVNQLLDLTLVLDFQLLVERMTDVLRERSDLWIYVQHRPTVEPELGGEASDEAHCRIERVRHSDAGVDTEAHERVIPHGAEHEAGRGIGGRFVDPLLLLVTHWTGYATKWFGSIA